MKKAALAIFIFILILYSIFCRPASVPDTDYPVEPVNYAHVNITDDFWSPKIEVNRTVSIQHCIAMHEETGELLGPKYIEGAAYMFAKRPDPDLEAYIDDQIEKTIAAIDAGLQSDQDPVEIMPGHFMEAAVAYYEATGKRKMLDTAIMLADRMDDMYGPGKKTYISGHERLKIDLVTLYRHTGDERYWKLAKFFLDERGKDDYERSGEYAVDRTYAQDHKPVIEQDESVGHCVRAVFLYVSLTDIAALTGEPPYADANQKIWEDSVFKKTYLTGGIGSIRFHEQYGAAYELPNLSAWNETCASYGNVVWNHRLFMLHRDAKYIDVLERVLYNGWLVGVSFKGDRFFYQNPLKSFGNYERFRWINVPCCPPNVVRLMASIGSYIYAKSGDDVYVNLFIGSEAEIETADNRVRLKQETRYPWEGSVKMTVEPEQEAKFTLLVRIPLWTRNQPMPGDLYHYMEAYDDPVGIKINGKAVEYEMQSGYAMLNRRWGSGDTVELDLPMRVRKVLPNRNIRDNKGLVALERGPIVYCAEWPDNEGGHVMNLLLHDDAVFDAEYRAGLLGGMTVVKGEVLALYREEGSREVKSRKQEMTAIPYYAWANRGMGEMAFWLPRRGDQARIFPVIPPSPIARVDSFGGIEKTWTGYHDQNDDLSAVFDGFDPLSSADESNLYFRMRPPAGKAAWVEYEFEKPTEISSAEVYWVDDRRFCRPPQTWRILYRDGAQWKPVENQQPYPVEKDSFNRVEFMPVTTSAVRLEVEPASILYKAGMIGPPAAMFIDEDVEWREFGIIEWRIK